MKVYSSLAVLLILLAAALPAAAAKDKNYSAAVTLIKSRDYDVAKTLLELSLKEDPTSIKVLNALGYIAEKKKDKQAALDYYRKIVLIQKAKGGSSKTAERAKQAIVRLSPASGFLLEKSEEIIAKARATKNEEEKALLQLSAKTLQDFALGEVEITIAKKPRKGKISAKPLTVKRSKAIGKKKDLKIPKEWIEFARKRDKLPANEQLVLIADELKKYNGAVDVKIRDHQITDGKITVLDLQDNRKLTSIAPLYGLPLETLCLRDAHSLHDLRPLKEARLRELDLHACVKLVSLEGIEGSQITELTMSKCPKIVSLEPLAGMRLTRLNLSDCHELRDLRPLKGMKLTELNLHVCAKLTSLEGIEDSQITELTMSKCPKIVNLKPLQRLSLTRLNLSDCHELRDLRPLKGMKLTELNLHKCLKLTSLAGIEGMPITTLNVHSCRSLRSLKGVEGMPLREIDITDCPNLKRIDHKRLMRIPTLEIVNGLDDAATLRILNATKKLRDKQKK